MAASKLNKRVIRLPERPTSPFSAKHLGHAGGRLGRHIEHDERSRAFATSHHKIHTAQHLRHCAPFDQGNLGSCTGNAMAGALMTGPLYETGRTLGEGDAITLYCAATKLDDVPGVYPPDDTGSSGLAVAKAAKRAGLLKGSYHHAFGVSAALAALSAAPVIVGINWYESFDAPVGSSAELKIQGGGSRGGHEVVLDGIDVEHGFVHGTNSWGLSWGNNGCFVMSFGTLKRLLAEDGDVVAFA